MKWTQAEKEALLRLSAHDGWRVLVDRMSDLEIAIIQKLSDSHFEDLLEVGRLQGELRAYQKLRRLVAIAEESTP